MSSLETQTAAPTEPTPPPTAPHAADDEPLFRVRGLTKGYGGRTVLDGLDFDIRRGECFVILGRSGSGKSVTLRQLNGLEEPDGGSVTFDGVELSTLRERELYPYRRRIAMLFQGGALFDSMTVAENIAFPLREHTDWDDRRIAEAVAERLRRVRLSGIEDRVPSALSGGMKKRVALARSLALDPQVVLFDEPTTGLDPVTSATIARLIRRIQRRGVGGSERSSAGSGATASSTGVTSVVVTHDLPLARTVGDRLAFLEDGRFRFLGTWEEADASDDESFRAFLEGREEDLGDEDEDDEGDAGEGDHGR